MSDTKPIDVGVIGVGAMGQHHARVYSELDAARLIGIADADRERAREIADEYGTEALNQTDLISNADAVSIAVPTPYHYDLAASCINNGTHLLIEKPLVEDPANGQKLIDGAKDAGVTLQVGHIERFNPVTETVQQIISDLEVISISARRLGPEPDRTIEDSAVTDLMIHDIDILCSLLDSDVANVEASGTADGRHATATIDFDSGVVGSLTASRVTQQKIRELTITAQSCYVEVDYIDQSVEIHRNSVPEYIKQNGDVRYRHESIVENPAVDTGEPLKYELQSFLDAAQNGHEPRVSGEDGMRALKLAQKVNRDAFGEQRETPEVLGE